MPLTSRPICPHCGEIGKSGALNGKSTRIGTYKWYGCCKPFTVKVGTISESSHIALNVWLQAMYLIAASKIGISSNQLHRPLGVTLRSADFTPFGNDGGAVEIDETFIGRDHSKVVRRGGNHKFKVLSLIDRTSGQARSMVVDTLKTTELLPIIQAKVSREAALMTDEAGHYKRIGKHFASHDSVNHGAPVPASTATSQALATPA